MLNKYEKESDSSSTDIKSWMDFIGLTKLTEELRKFKLLNRMWMSAEKDWYIFSSGK